MRTSPISSRVSAVMLLAIVIVLVGLVLSVSMGSKWSCMKNEQDGKINKHIESFVATASSLPLTAYNKATIDAGCNRNLEFLYQPGSTKSVSQRALIEESNATCPSNMNSEIPSSDLVEITEGEVDYVLKAKCFNIPCKNIENVDNETIILTFDSSQVDSIRDMFLLNPLFFEFNGKAAYIPEYQNSSTSLIINSQRILDGFSFSTWKDGKISKEYSDKFVLQCRKINTSFGGLKYSDNTASFDVKDIIFPNTISVKAYYLYVKDSASTNFDVVFDSNPNRTVKAIKFYDKNFLALSVNSNFYFQQKLSIIFNNRITPVLTLRFTFNLTKSKATSLNMHGEFREIMRVFMDAPYGQYSWSQGNMKPIDSNTRGNMFSAFVSSINENYDSFILAIGLNQQKSNGELNYNFENGCTIELPYNYEQNSHKVAVTVSPFETILYVQWNDDNGNYNYTYKRSKNCDKNTSMYNIFTQSLDIIFPSSDATKAVRQADFFLKYDNAYLTSLNNIMLGYRVF